MAKKVLEKVHPEGSDWKRQEWDISGREEKNVSKECWKGVVKPGE